MEHQPEKSIGTEPTDDQLADFVAKKQQEQTRHAAATAVKRIESQDHFPSEAPAAAQQREEEAARRAEIRHKQELFERWRVFLHDAGARYGDCTLDNFKCVYPEQTAVVAALREYIAADCPAGVIFFGPVGTGKDHLAFSVCRSALKSGKTVRWMNGQKWFGIIRDSMDSDRSEASLIAELARPDLLCLSDPLPPIGPLTQFQATMLYRIVDARYSRGVPTISTMNVHDDAEADERMGEATWDRLCHDAWKFRCDWETYRRPARVI